MSLDPCDYCGTWEGVMWDLEAGSVCLPCLDKREAEKKAEKEKYEDDIQDFFYHE